MHGEFLIMRPFDRFDGQIEEGVGKHQVQSLPQYMGRGAHTLRWEVWFGSLQIR